MFGLDRESSFAGFAPSTDTPWCQFVRRSQGFIGRFVAINSEPNPGDGPLRGPDLQRCRVKRLAQKTDLV